MANASQLGKDGLADNSAGTDAGGGPHPADHAPRRHGQNLETYVGANVRRFGGRERVSGTQQFLADIALPDMLHVKLVTLDAARARIISIDTTEALAVPGVVDILTARYLPKPVPRFGPVYKDRPVLAVGETEYHGEPVAAVAAESIEAAELAVSLVRVEYETLPAVFSLAGALAAGAPLVQDPALRAGDPLAATNILKERRYGWGDVDAAKVDVIVDNSYSFPMVTHFAIEPHGFMASAEKDVLKIWSPVQHPFLLQRIMADLFDLPLTQVRVFAPDPGGGFGGKQNPKLEPLVTYFSLRTGRPCRLVLSLEETFQAVRRTAAEIHVRTGFTRSGDLLFQDIKSDFLIGAYADIAERVMTKANYLGCGPYRTPNARNHARAVLSHTTPSCAFRGFGAPQIAWAVESQMDAAARELGLDGLNIRMRNLAGKGDEIVRGDVPRTVIGRHRWAGLRTRWAGAPRLLRGVVAASPSASSPAPPRSFKLDRAAASRRQRHHLCRNVRHGPGGTDDFCSACGGRSRRAAGKSIGGDGGYFSGAFRSADICEPLDGFHGHRHLSRLRRYPRATARDGRRSAWLCHD